LTTSIPATLDSPALARRLAELAGDERRVQVDFLLHLDEFDRRRAFLEAGYESLWTYCLRVLHLREGAAGRRIGAMRVLRRFPGLQGALRDGRLCLSTVTLLGPLLAEDKLDDLVARAAYRTKAEVEHLVATLQPRTAPREGFRKLPSPTSDATGLPIEPPAAAATVATTRTEPEAAEPSPSLEARARSHCTRRARRSVHVRQPSLGLQTSQLAPRRADPRAGAHVEVHHGGRYSQR
jgi:hypothetical protein